MPHKAESQTAESLPERRRAFGSLRQFNGVWWARYRVDGKETWESLRTPNLKTAEKKLAVLEDRVGRGEHQAPNARRVTFADLERMVRSDYANKGRRSLPRASTALAHLRATFGTMRALAISADRISAYEAERLEAGAARASVNYELALLRRMFSLAVKARRLTFRPSISTPAAHNARTGFFEPSDFAAVLEQLPEHLKAPMHFAYLTGWRVRSEVLALTWDRVDFRAGVVRLDTSKNDEGRTFPFNALPDLAALLTAQRDATKALERERDKIIPYVFHRNGAPIRSHYNAWRAAVNRAAVDGKKGPLAVIVRPQLVGRIAHDFRRTAVRNLVRAGVPERIAMKLTGHRRDPCSTAMTS